MASRTRSALTDAEREHRRRQHRERLEQACRELLISDGWKRWVKVRSANGLSRYSFHNQCLLAMQAHERGIELSYVAGFRTLLKLGRAVRRGERALWVLAPHTATINRDRRDGHADETAEGEERRIFFRAVPVFDVSQTEKIASVEAAPLSPPGEPLDGDSHAHLIPSLIDHAGDSAIKSRCVPSPPGSPTDGATPAPS